MAEAGYAVSLRIKASLYEKLLYQANKLEMSLPKFLLFAAEDYVDYQNSTPKKTADKGDAK